MIKIIDGTNATLGRLASYAAKQVLRGEEIIILNCDKVVISGNKVFLQKDFQEKRSKVGSSLKGPRVSKSSDRIVKRVIRGMLPDHRIGRGKEALKKIKCYTGVPKEFENKKKISAGKEKGIKLITVKELVNN